MSHATTRITKVAAILLLLSAPAFAADGGDNPLDESAPSVPAARGAAAPANGAQVPSPRDPKIDLAEGGPTVVCDGKGGYQVDMKGKQILLFGSCLKTHESSHVGDLERTCPGGCRGQAAGAEHPTGNSGGRCAAFATEADFWRWRIQSECKAYNAELACLRALYKKADDDQKGRLRARIKQVRASIRFWNGKGSEETPALACAES